MRPHPLTIDHQPSTINHQPSTISSRYRARRFRAGLAFAGAGRAGALGSRLIDMFRLPSSFTPLGAPLGSEGDWTPSKRVISADRSSPFVTSKTLLPVRVNLPPDRSTGA